MLLLDDMQELEAIAKPVGSIGSGGLDGAQCLPVVHTCPQESDGKHSWLSQIEMILVSFCAPFLPPFLSLLLSILKFLAFC